MTHLTQQKQMQVKQIDLQKSTGKNLPEMKIRAGPVKVTVWSNQSVGKSGKPVTFRTITLDRSYLDKNGEWQHTNSLRLNDLPKAMLALSKVYEDLLLRGMEQGSSEGAIPEEPVL
ncbi:hypothetical protein HYW21_03450 [Candidatus Woesearchaeota archaeon]|nr:hypothetical protein [Candidatus Woesearchaeota archaeon]